MDSSDSLVDPVEFRFAYIYQLASARVSRIISQNLLCISSLLPREPIYLG